MSGNMSASDLQRMSRRSEQRENETGAGLPWAGLCERCKEEYVVLARRWEQSPPCRGDTEGVHICQESAPKWPGKWEIGIYFSASCTRSVCTMNFIGHYRCYTFSQE